MLIERTNMLVTNVNPRKEGQGEGMTLASDLKVSFEVPRALMDKLVPDQERKFSDQFYTNNGDIRLTHLYPIAVHQTFEELNVAIYMSKQPTEFKPAKMKNVELEPLSGGYVRATATLQVHPTPIESGKLDNICKEVVEISIDTLTGDIEDAGADTTDSK